jgi:N-methylhydantoinase B
LGQTVEVGTRDGSAFEVLAMYERVATPARGREGGADGAAGIVRLASGERLRAKGLQTIPAGDRLVLELPGGGGLGKPGARDPVLVAADVSEGRVSHAAATRDYGDYGHDGNATR